MLFSENTKDALKTTKQRMSKYQDEFLEQLTAIEVDAHWFRRVFHTFAASFLFYYLLPDEEWINVIKIIVPVILVFCLIVIEYHRLRGALDHQRFFGLRNYEKKRPASYLYFGIAVLLLFLLFPQQIAIPCILCASFTDPVIGETRYHLGKKKAYIIGFIISLFFFLITWFRADWRILILVSVIGAAGALAGEAKKLRYIDDDFMIQMLPALLLLLFWQGSLAFGINILPPKIILPI
ncbi:MAG TPA: dolichol kinase [Candidatus Thermoplasmatota archaeon]|nr:dolichol kinase [Candidatus Thermoplasmatota archaeon]